VFARLRKAERRALWGEGRESVALKARAALHHVEEGIAAFVERNIVALLHASHSLGPLGVELERIEMATNRVRVELRAADDGGEALWITFVERDGRLLAGVSEPGWLERLTDARRRAMTTAIAGLYKMSGVDAIVGFDAKDHAPATDDGHEAPF